MESGVLKLCYFFYWTTTDKLEFTDWSGAQRRFGSREVVDFPKDEDDCATSWAY